jgi:hypothetical protein
MNIDNLSPKEIQEQIFVEIGKGTNVEIIKTALKDKGQNPEGYYFTTAAKHNEVINAPKEPAGQMSGLQIFGMIISIIFIIIRIARCSSKM